MIRPRPRDHREAIALFRAEIIGALTRRTLLKGELRPALEALSQIPHRAPRSAVSRFIAVSTLERWYDAYKRSGLAGLTPRPRSDKGTHAP